MRIAILGGTGSIGEGFACRWAQNHEIYIGSRKPEKAREAANAYKCELTEKGFQCKISGFDNENAVRHADIVVLSVPHKTLEPLLQSLKPVFKDQIVISLVVPMTKNEWFHYTPPPEGSAAVQVQRLLPDVPVVSAYHNVSAKKLCSLDRTIEGDVVVCGDDEESKKIVMELTREIKNLRPLDGGPLEMSYMIESLTPFLLNLAKRNNIHNLGVKFV